MAKFVVTYAIANRPERREIAIELVSTNINFRSVARAILKHEFPEVDAPFGPGEVRTAEQALARFAISDVKTVVVLNK